MSDKKANVEGLDEQELQQIAGGVSAEQLADLGSRTASQDLAVKPGYSPYASWIRVSEVVGSNQKVDPAVLTQVGSLLKGG